MAGPACHRVKEEALLIPAAVARPPLARINVVLYLSSCTPCSSSVVEALAGFVRANREHARLTVVVSPLAPGAPAVLVSQLKGTGSRFVTEADGWTLPSSRPRLLPFLLIFDDRKRILRAEALAPVAGAHVHLREELDYLYALNYE